MDLVRKHQENQGKIGKTSRAALAIIRENMHKDARDKKNEVMEQIHKLLAIERQTVKELEEFENRKNEEILRLSTDAQRVTKQPSPENTRFEELKNQQMNSIWSDTLQELDVVFERQKTNLKRLAESPRESPMPTSAHNLNALKEQRISIIEVLTKEMNEFHRRLDQIREEIDRNNQQIEDNEKKEREEMEKIFHKARAREKEELDQTWQTFLGQIKRSEN